MYIHRPLALPRIKYISYNEEKMVYIQLKEAYKMATVGILLIAKGAGTVLFGIALVVIASISGGGKDD